MARNGAVSWYKSTNGKTHSKCGRFEIFPVMEMARKTVKSFTLIDSRHDRSYKNIKSQSECKNMADRIIKSENSKTEEDSNTLETKAGTNKLKIKTIVHPGKHFTVAENTLFVMETPDGKRFDIYYEGVSGGVGIRTQRGTIEVTPTSSNAIVVKNMTLADEIEKRRNRS